MIDPEIAEHNVTCIKEVGEPLLIAGNNNYLAFEGIYNHGEPQMLIEHHMKYKEIDGIDKTVWMTRSEHYKTHRNNKLISAPKIPKKVILAAHCRTQKHKAKHIHFIETIAPNIRLREGIYYATSGNVLYFSYFNTNHGKKLLEVNI